MDFIFLDTEPTLHPDTGIPIILGRPFLTTTNALINFRSRRMKITFGSMTAELKIFNVMQQQMEDNECHYVNLIDTVRCRVGHLFFLKGSFVFLNLFRVRNRETRSHHLVYWSKNHKYDFMYKRTSLELSSELRYILGRC